MPKINEPLRLVQFGLLQQIFHGLKNLQTMKKLSKSQLVTVKAGEGSNQAVQALDANPYG